MEIPEPLAFVTGASSGFGLGASIALAKKGFFVIATMRDIRKAATVMELAEQAGVHRFIRCLQLDVTNEACIAKLVTDIVMEYGRIDLLVNNAGIAVAGFIEELTMDDWRKQFETNFFGMVAVTKAILPVFRNTRSGRIINIGSVSGRFGLPAMGPYAASKFAMEGFSESLRLEMLPFGVYVSLIEPGAFKTGIWEKSHIRTAPYTSYGTQREALQKRMEETVEAAGDPDEVVQLIVRIAASPTPPKLRYPIGKGVRRNLALKAMLPWEWLERAVVRSLQRVIRNR